ncbi:MAG: Ig-like domain-containing protein [Candidatus Shapirobacteria bacterium]|jgi:hypothetical protein
MPPAPNPATVSASKTASGPDNQKTTVVFIICCVVVALLIALILAWRAVVFFGKKPETTSIAYDNSYLFVSPLSAKANGQEPIRVTVLLLDNQGNGIPNQTVILGHSQVLSIINSSALTDETGKAIFDLVTVVAGQYPITAKTADLPISQSVTASFD